MPEKDIKSPADTIVERASPLPVVDDLARPLIDPDRLVDPRPVLAAARAAASQAKVEMESDADLHSQARHSRKPLSNQMPYRSVLLGSAFLGLLMIVFGRDAVQFLSASPLHPVLSRP